MLKTIFAALAMMFVCACGGVDGPGAQDCLDLGGEWVCGDAPASGGGEKCWCDLDQAKEAQFEPEPQPWKK